MSLALAKPALKTKLLELAANTDENKTPTAAIDEFVDALETFIKAAAISVPGTGLVAPPGGGPVTGVSTPVTIS